MNERVDRISWENLFIEIAKLVSKRSEDPHTQVGAVIVKDNKILSFGYNGTPNKFNHDFNWQSEDKYKFIVHAELNAILNAAHNGVNINGADIYLTVSPCIDCIKSLIQAGIKNVYYLQEYRDINMSKLIGKSISPPINFIKIC